jgi:aminodeoxyfutalosine deaminase
MRFISATSIFTGQHTLPAGCVLVLGNQNMLKEIIHETEVDPGNVRHFEGVITPGFVNAHCHLELSHLRGKFPKHTGLPKFGKNVILNRTKAHPEEVAEHMTEADREMWNNGVVAVGDISNEAGSFKIKAGSKISYHTFIELLGFDPRRSEEIFSDGLTLLANLRSDGLRGSLAPHAPYSTSRELISKIAGYSRDNGEPLSIHNQESAEETKFFKGGGSAFYDLYKFLGIDISWFKPPGVSSLEYLAAELKDTNSVLVHNTFSERRDVMIADGHWWCFCPGANEYIENRFPSFELFASKKDRICVGTDSLASNTHLDPLREINLILTQSRTFEPDDLLKAITYNGAAALGMSEECGHLHAKKPGLNLIKFDKGKYHFIEKII